MTREEQRKVRTTEQELKKKIREACKRHKYKTVDGCGYKVVNGYIYDVYVWVADKGETLTARLCGKLLALDELFWEIFGIKEEVKNKPMSFHLLGAFVADTLILDEWKSPLESLEKMDEVLDDIFAVTEDKVTKYAQEFQEIECYKKAMEHEGKEYLKLNIMMCDILQGHYKEVLDHLESELAEGNTGRFFSVQGGGIYDRAKQYCRKMLEA